MFTDTQRVSLNAYSFTTSVFLLSGNNHPFFVSYILANLLVINYVLIRDWLLSDPIGFHRFFRTTQDIPRIRTRQEEVLKLYKEGKTHDQIALALECSLRTVKRDLEELGLTKKRNKKPDGT